MRICDLLPKPRPSWTGTQLFPHRETCVGSSSCCPMVLSLHLVLQDHHHCHCQSVSIHVDMTCNWWKDQYMDSYPLGI
jgi:hypothetical protein